MNIKLLVLFIALFSGCTTTRHMSEKEFNQEFNPQVYYEQEEEDEEDDDEEKEESCFQLRVNVQDEPTICKEYTRTAPKCPTDWENGYCALLWESGKYPPAMKNRIEGHLTIYC